MIPGRPEARARILSSIGDVPAAQWDACAGAEDPFVSHAFLSALEDSGSATAETGWLPRHVVVERSSADGVGDALIAAAPLYLKGHSYGEFVFDWGWAEAFERAGGRYYPKLQSAVPFTPVTGRRLLVRRDATDRRQELADALIAAMLDEAKRLGVSSLHVTFPTETEWRLFGDRGFLLRTGQQFQWRNQGYRSFEDFLGALSSRKRKAIRKERRAVSEAGIEIDALSGRDIREADWDAFYRFYRMTSDHKWGPSYLTRRFFSLLGERLGDRVVLFAARRDGRPVAGALNLLGADALYGRTWGCSRHYRFLHFEACYYKAIEYAIERRLGRVEAGAQGPHKLQRGYLPVATYSAHWIAEPAFREAVARFLERERRAVEAEMGELTAFSPFRQPHGGGGDQGSAGGSGANP
jgi:predicted N-acyltransferase